MGSSCKAVKHLIPHFCTVGVLLNLQIIIRIESSSGNVPNGRKRKISADKEMEGPEPPYKECENHKMMCHYLLFLSLNYWLFKTELQVVNIIFIFNYLQKSEVSNMKKNSRSDSIKQERIFFEGIY